MRSPTTSATPRALAIAHEVAADASLTDAQRRALLLDFDRVLGLSLERPAEAEAPLPEGADELLERRAAARAARDFAASDALRDELAAIGVEVRDTPDGQETLVPRKVERDRGSAQGDSDRECDCDGDCGRRGRDDRSLGLKR